MHSTFKRIECLSQPRIAHGKATSGQSLLNDKSTRLNWKNSRVLFILLREDLLQGSHFHSLFVQENGSFVWENSSIITLFYIRKAKKKNYLSTDLEKKVYLCET